MRTSRRLTYSALGVVVALVAGCSDGDGDPTPPPTTSAVQSRSTSHPASSPAPPVVSAPGVGVRTRVMEAAGAMFKQSDNRNQPVGAGARPGRDEGCTARFGSFQT